VALTKLTADSAVGPSRRGTSVPRIRRPWWRRLGSGWGYLFILPPVLGFFVFYAYPTFFALYASFFKFNNFKFSPLSNPFDNYRRALTDPVVHRSFLNVVEMFFITFVGAQVISLFLAVLVHTLKYWQGFFRTLYYIPMVTSVVVISAVFKWFFRSDATGMMNMILKIFTGLGPIRWLWDEWLIIPSVSLASIWAAVGGAMIVWTAGLKGLPEEIYEAAEIDGANGWRQFWGVTLPLLKPIAMYQAVLSFIGGMKAFALNMVMLPTNTSVQMPPTAGTTPVLLVYVYGFRRLQMGFASAMAFLLSIVILLLSLLQFRLFGSSEVYD
jgi:multiple sugar transport system permease protein